MDPVRGVATAAAGALIAVAGGADRAMRRSDVRAYPARHGGPMSRLGRIGQLAVVLAAVITGIVAFAVRA
ncbi:hypothetical protein AB3M83_06800 [Microbacterium sp. 179-B 1A2 NHS]|uniref:hypothetical protein n=1 Tax=Microbacterium sp. 179-B 1A2 NHS TaxID=3142383 RepID=UPI0039A00E4E